MLCGNNVSRALGIIFATICVFTPDIRAEIPYVDILNERKNEVLSERRKNRQEMAKQRAAQVSFRINIAKREGEIDFLNRSVFDLKNKIEQGKSEIVQLELRIAQNVGILRGCLTSVYHAENPSVADIILVSRNLGDFLDKAELARFFSLKISSTIDEINRSIEHAEQIKIKNEKRVEKIAQRKVELAKKRDELSELLEGCLEAQESLNQEFDESDAELRKIEKELEEYNSRYLPGESFSGEKPKLAWPVHGFSYISSGFDDMVGRRSKHCAIDIAGRGIYGAKVSAAAKGKVIKASAGTYGGGYGTFVIIDHGSGYVTIYAHMSGIAVKLGESVKQGQTLGWVGSTGFSTGPHLHFEFRHNNSKINPLQSMAKR